MRLFFSLYQDQFHTNVVYKRKALACCSIPCVSFVKHSMLYIECCPSPPPHTPTHHTVQHSMLQSPQKDQVMASLATKFKEFLDVFQNEPSLQLVTRLENIHQELSELFTPNVPPSTSIPFSPPPTPCTQSSTPLPISSPYPHLRRVVPAAKPWFQ